MRGPIKKNINKVPLRCFPAPHQNTRAPRTTSSFNTFRFATTGSPLPRSATTTDARVVGRRSRSRRGRRFFSLSRPIRTGVFPTFPSCATPLDSRRHAIFSVLLRSEGFTSPHTSPRPIRSSPRAWQTFPSPSRAKRGKHARAPRPRHNAREAGVRGGVHVCAPPGLRSEEPAGPPIYTAAAGPPVSSPMHRRGASVHSNGGDLLLFLGCYYSSRSSG